MRERNGRSLPFVFEREDESLPTIHQRIEPGTTVYPTKLMCWDQLHARFAAKRVNHSLTFEDEDACTNQAESYFSRLRRMEIGTHHHVSGRYLKAYAREAAWRVDNRRIPNDTLYLVLAGTSLGHLVPRNWKGYWQWHTAC